MHYWMSPEKTFIRICFFYWWNMSRNTQRELICSHTKTYIVPSGGNFWKHKWKLFTAPSFRSNPNTKKKKKPCHLYLYHQNPNTGPALSHRCLAASKSLLHFKESRWSPRDCAWEHANKFPTIHRKADKWVQPRPPWEGNKRKASFNTTPQITRCSVYRHGGLATKGFGKTNNLGNAAVFKAVSPWDWRGRKGRCRQALLKGAWSPIMWFWGGPLETLHRGGLYLN